MTLLPEVAVNVPALQVVEALAVFATPTLAGKLSVKSSPVAATVLTVLSMVNVRVLMPPETIALGEKLLLKVGGELTVSVAAAVPLFPKDEVKSPVVLTCAPAVLPVTSTVTVQLAPADAVPPV